MRRIRRRQAMARSTASGASSFMSPPPWPRRTTSFSRVNVSNRSPPTARATTRWKLFVPMSSAASTGGSPGFTASLPDPGEAGVESIEHTLAEGGDLLEAAAQDVVGRRVVADDERGLDRLVQVAGLDAGRAVVTGDGVVREQRRGPRARQAVVGEEARLALQRAVERGLGRLAVGTAEHVADDEVTEPPVQVAQ